MIFKNHLGKIIATTIMIASSVTFARSLVVVNNTNRDSSVKIKEAGNTCSPKTTRRHSTTSASSFTVGVGCRWHEICHATMYPSLNCTGQPVAKITINTKTIQIQDKKMLDSSYSLNVNGNVVTINGGPSA